MLNLILLEFYATKIIYKFRLCSNENHLNVVFLFIYKKKKKTFFLAVLSMIQIPDQLLNG